MITRCCCFESFQMYLSPAQISFYPGICWSMLIWIVDETSQQISAVLSLQSPSLFYSALEILAILVSLNSWLCFFNLENLLVSTRIPSPCTLSWKPSKGSKLRQPWGSLPLYSVFQESLFFIAWNLMSCKAVVSYILLVFVCFSPEHKCSLYYYTLVRNRNQFILFCCQEYSLHGCTSLFTHSLIEELHCFQALTTWIKLL